MAETSKYLIAARQALQEKNYEDAKKYYDMVKVEDPTNAEAKIQYQYAKFMDCTNGEAYNCYTDYMNLLKYAVDNIAASEMPVEEQIAFLSQLVDNSVNTLNQCVSAMNYIRVENDGTFAKTQRLKRESILFARSLGDAIEQKYKDNNDGMQAACKAWKSFVNRANGNTCVSKEEEATIPSYVEKIQKIEPDFNFVAKKRGCF